MDLRTERITRSNELRQVAIEKGHAFLAPRNAPAQQDPPAVKPKRSYHRKPIATQEVPTCSQP